MNGQVLVTGANGFIGRAVLEELRLSCGYGLIGSVRSRASVIPEGVEPAVAGPLSADTDWQQWLGNVSVVVHTAARVHVMGARVDDPGGAFRETNVHGTLTLARQAADAGVRRFIYLSSIKVNGEETRVGRPFEAHGQPAPHGPYAISKWEAEQALEGLADESGMEVVIIRPVLVYGPGVKGNFRTLMRLVHAGIPLPLGSIDNRRSLISLDNLSSLIRACVEAPQLGNQIFIGADGEDMSTPELLRRVGRAMGRPARLFRFPKSALSGCGAMVGRERLVQRIAGSLQADIGETCRTLGWTPPRGVDEGLSATVRQFLSGPG